MEFCRYLRVVFDDKLASCSLGDENLSKIDLGQVSTDEGILSNCTQFDYSLGLSLDFEDDGPYCD